jgi:hypothetical protein
MAPPRGRREPQRGKSRGGSYSQRSSRQPANRNARSSGGGYGNGYGGGQSDRGGGGNNTALIAVIALGGVALVVLLLVLVLGGDNQSNFQVDATRTPEADQTPVRSGPPPDLPPPPLTPAEKARVKEVVERLALKEPEALRLKVAGFEALEKGQRELAQEHWREARDLLQGMIFEAETLFETLGSERVERDCYRYYDITGKWPQILSDFLKHIE